MPRGRRANNRPQLLFNRKRVLHKWLLGLFGVERFGQLAEHVKDEAVEGLDENNNHRFHHTPCLHLPADQRPELSDEVLLEYDQEVTRLKYEMGGRTVAVDAFEGNNLVLADEVHRGASAGRDGAWMKRNALCEKGFSFEYSATFG